MLRRIVCLSCLLLIVRLVSANLINAELTRTDFPINLQQDQSNRAHQSTLLSESVIEALDQELSGETAKRNLEYIARHHRMRGSRGFRAAAEFIVEQLRAYGLTDAHIEQFAADGKIFYGTQKSRPAWDADFAELWELRETSDPTSNKGTDKRWTPFARLASWEAMPIVLAQDSESADVSADLVDVANGTSERDYAGKEVRGKIVLAAAQPGEVASLAVEKYGAVGIISYAQNQRTAWWGENENLVRWGHLETFAKVKTFAFMVSLKQAREFQNRLNGGERIRLRAKVKAGKHPGFYDVATATISGADSRLKDEEIAFSCHLDHPRPGANDNASGSVAILEVARTLAMLIRENRIQRPARTIRFIWPPEIEGTVTLLNARPELAARIKAAVHMDMVGGGPETKAIFHVTRGPASLPSFVYDVAEHFGAFVNDQSASFAGGARPRFPLFSAEGGKEALLAEMVEFTAGSDHQVYTESSWSIPAIYLNDWPDRFIHTNFDTPANIDPTKLKRAAFIGAASGYFLANLSASDAPSIIRLLQQQAVRRSANILKRRAELVPAEAGNLTRQHLSYERAVVESLARFLVIPDNTRSEALGFLANLEKLSGGVKAEAAAQDEGTPVFRRNSQVKGPMSVFGYDYFTDHYGAEREAKLRLLQYTGLRGSGGDYAYEVLNLVDGHRTTQEIRDVVSAEYGPVPVAVVLEYLRALESIGVIKGER